MPYRRAYKRPRYGKRDKYSVQQKAFQFSADSGTSSTWLLVPATTLEGMRKVKHLMVNLTIDPDSVGPMWWAIVYVPQGTTVGSINVTTSASATGMYEPNQFVMNCGIADPTAGPIRFSSPVARNLNDGDAIALVVRHTNSAARTVMRTCRYAITLNKHQFINTPSGAVILHRPFLSLKNSASTYIMTWHYDVIFLALSYPITFFAPIQI